MPICRPKGGRAAPRYHHVKDAAEKKYFAAIEQREKEPLPTQTEIYIYILNKSMHYVSEAMSRLRRLCNK